MNDIVLSYEQLRNNFYDLVEWGLPRLILLIFVFSFGLDLIVAIIHDIQDKTDMRRYYTNVSQIMRRFEMQGIYGVDITYHHGEMYVNYLDYSVSAYSLLDALMIMQERLYIDGLYHPPKWFIKRLKRRDFWKSVKVKICR